jgi:hypothetical protein
MLQERQSDGTYTPLDHAANPGSDQWHKNGHDEFLIYTKAFSDYRTYYNNHEDTYEEIKGLAWEGDVIPIREDLWSTNGRVMAFRTHDYKTQSSTEYLYGLQEDGTYNIYFLTRSTNNQDVVRVASNNSMSYNAYPNNRTNTDPDYSNRMYEGNEYRSIIFDVAHYRPFRFAAQVRVADENGANPQLIPATSELLGNKTHGDTPESEDVVELKYKPGQRVDILFDITSFEGSDGCSVHPFGENFGDPFEVYIDAPMLEIDYNRYPEAWRAENGKLGVDKLRKHPTIPGRYIYTVDRHRDHEREYGGVGLAVANVDNAQKHFDQFGHKVAIDAPINQTGERKLLPFKKTSITAGGDINITTDKNAIIYWDKTFNVETSHIIGKIYYEKDGKRVAIPKDAFVAFVRLRTGARIGVVTITDDGMFELNLRDEYQFKWEDDSIDFYYTDANGNVYNFNYTENGVAKAVDLNLLYTLIIERNEPIVLSME